jgi:hypothetical protein
MTQVCVLCINVLIHELTYVRMHVKMYVRKYVCMYAYCETNTKISIQCMYVCIYVCVQTRRWVYSICMSMCSESSGVCIYNKYRDGYTVYISVRIVTFVPE